MRFRFAFLFILLLLVNFQTKAQFNEVFTAGPMLHINIGEKPARLSFGLEAAYWNYNHFPYSIDFGIDRQKHAWRIYSEIQTGIGLMGVSSGPFIEFRKEEPVRAGLQSDIWLNYIGGVNLRFRFQKGKDIVAPGVYFKVPWYKNPEKHENSNSNHHWDWD